ncbi:MAG: hypothetical protein QXM25_04395, partial [Nitrososphaerales archaeon]
GLSASTASILAFATGLSFLYERDLGCYEGHPIFCVVSKEHVKVVKISTICTHNDCFSHKKHRLFLSKT